MSFNKIISFLKDSFFGKVTPTLEEPTDITIDWKSYLDHHFPHIGSIYLTPSEMRDVNKKLTKRNQLLLQGSSATYATNIYDHFVKIIEPKIGTPREREIAKGLLKFIDISIAEFKVHTQYDPALFVEFKKQLKNLFHDNDAKYLEKLAELLATVYVIRSSKDISLISMEEKFQLKNGIPDFNGKDADVLTRNDNSGETSLIDILSVNLDFEKIESPEGLEKAIRYRIDKKWNSKEFNDPSLKQRYNKVQLQVFMWIYDIETILKYKDVFINFEENTILPFLFLVQHTDDKGQVIYKCQQVFEIS